jgi:hypothetical protein
MTTRLKTGLWAFGLVGAGAFGLVAALAVGAWLSAPGVPSGVGSGRPGGNPDKASGVVQVDADTLERAFRSNEVDARAKYADRWLEVSGEVARVFTTKTDKTSGGSGLMLNDHWNGVRCLCPESELAGLRTHQQVRAKGYCKGVIQDERRLGNLLVNHVPIVCLTDCKITWKDAK